MRTTPTVDGSPQCDPKGRQSAAPVLRCEGYGAGFGARVILSEVDIEVRANGITVLMGPGGTGKSTLLNSLAGLYEKNDLYKCWGAASYLGAPLSSENRPSLVVQRIQLTRRSVLDNLIVYRKQGQSPASQREAAREWLEQLQLWALIDRLDEPWVDLGAALQRIVAILREASVEPALLMLDEPTSGLGDDEAALVLRLIESLGRRIALLVVLHNQKQARRISDSVILLAGGRVQAQDDTQNFFHNPRNPLVAHFIATGSCSVAAPDCRPEFLAAHVAPPPPLPRAALVAMRAGSDSEYVETRGAKARTSSAGPRGFVWVIEGRLGGAPQPGSFHAIDYDLELLQNVGVTTLITLTEVDLPQDALLRHGMDNHHCAIVDRRAPTIPQTDSLLAHMRRLLDLGKVLAVHCRAGVGRTGVILAAYLIKEQGLGASDALAFLRRLNSNFVQTSEQEEFLFAYEQAIRTTSSVSS